MPWSKYCIDKPESIVNIPSPKSQVSRDWVYTLDLGLPEIAEIVLILIEEDNQVCRGSYLDWILNICLVHSDICLDKQNLMNFRVSWVWSNHNPSWLVRKLSMTNLKSMFSSFDIATGIFGLGPLLFLLYPGWKGWNLFMLITWCTSTWNTHYFVKKSSKKVQL